MAVLSWFPLARAESDRSHDNLPRPSDHKVHSVAVTERGAVADRKTLNNQAFQAAIDAVAAGGGGGVSFPPEVYLSGPVSLKRRVTLSPEAGATLLGSTNEVDYKSVAKNALINGDDLEQYPHHLSGRRAWPRLGMSKMPVKENPEACPDILRTTQGYVPSYGLFTRHVKGLRLRAYP